MVNTLSRGQVKVGKMYGQISASAGSISSSEIAADAILTTHITAGDILTTHILAGEIRTTHIQAGEIDTSHITAKAVETAQLGSLAVGTTNIAAAAVTSPKMSFSWSTMSNTTASVTTITLPAAQGGYVITHIGAGSGIVVTSAGLSAPTAGDHYKFLYDVAASSKPLHFKSATATFDSTGAKVIGIEAAGQYFGIEALSSVRWVVTEFSTGLIFSSTT